MIDMLVKGGIINFLHSQGVNTIQTADEGNQPPGDTFRGIIWPELTRFGPALDYLQRLFMPHAHRQQIRAFNVSVAIGQQLRFAP